MIMILCDDLLAFLFWFTVVWITEAAASKAVAANVYHHMGSIAAVAFEGAAADVQQALQSPGAMGPRPRPLKGAGNLKDPLVGACVVL